MIDGVAACIYLGALWYIAPLHALGDASLATRLRNVLVLGIAIPLVLAAVHAFYTPVVWIIVGALAFSRTRFGASQTQWDLGEGLTLAASVALAWPALVRPVIEGDSLFYHLPVAASWAQSHSLYATNAPYWYYPPGSEAFLSGLFLVAGRFALPLASIIAMLMLVARLYEFGVERGASAFTSGVIALSFVATPCIAFQAGTLANDLVLAAFFVEVLVGARPSFALTIGSLVKPVGWVWTIGAAFVAKVSWRAILFSLLPLVLWVAHDWVLLQLHPLISVASPSPYLASTIAGNAPRAFFELFRSIVLMWPQVLLWLCLIVVGCTMRETRAYGLLGFACAIAYTFLPVSYAANGVNYALNGSSIRYAFPALACGALVWLCVAKNARLASTIVGILGVVSGMVMLGMTFANDGYTLVAPAAAGLVAIGVLLMRATRGTSVALALALVIVLGAFGAQSRSAAFFASWMRDGSGQPTQLFAWIEREKPARAVAVDIRTGAIIMASPATFTIAADDPSNACRIATEQHALVILGTNETSDPALQQHERAAIRSCGHVLFEDGASMVVSP